MSGQRQTVSNVADNTKRLAVEKVGTQGFASASSEASAMASIVDAQEVGSGGRGRVTSMQRPRRIDPDDGRFIRLVVVGVLVAGVVAFAISFTALYEVAGWLGLPPFMWWAVPVFIDLAILVYAASVLVHKARGERTLASWSALGTFTALSVFANAAHAWSYAQDHDERWQGMVGAVIAGMVPVAIFVATEQLSRVAVEDPQSRRAELLEQARMEQARAEHERQRTHLRFEREQQERQLVHELAVAERTAELEQERHRTEVARLQAGRDQELRRVVQPATEPYSPNTPPPAPPTERTDQDKPAGQTPTVTGLQVVDSGPTAAAVTGSGTMSALDEAAEFVTQQCTEGVEVSAVMLAERFGISPRTGRRRLQKLREERPEVFSKPVADHGRKRT